MEQRKFLKSRPSQCTVCQRCALACAFKNSKQYDIAYSAIKVEEHVPDSFQVRLRYCIQCSEEECIKACATEALYRNESGVVALDKSKCISCFACVSACSKGLIYQHENLDFPIKCDLCGGNPLCIEECPEDILRL